MSEARSGTRSEFPARRNVIALQIIPESQSIGLRTGGRECLFLAPNGPPAAVAALLLLGDERTQLRHGPRSEFDPNRSFKAPHNRTTKC